MIDDWQSAPDELERDTALSMLRELYTAIKFGDCTCGATPEPTTVTPVAQPADADKCNLCESEECFEVEPSEPCGAEPVVEVVEEAVRQQPVHNEKCESEECFEVEPSEPCPVEPTESYATVQPIEEPTPAPESEPEILVAPRKISKDAIAALYGEPSVSHTDRQPTKSEEPLSDKAATVNPVTTTRTVLGDVINSGAQRLGDTLVDDRQDVASRIAAADTTDLRHAMGINDKFLIMCDLFDGRNDKFEKVISELDAQPTFDDALIYISDFSWNASSDGAKLLMQLLKRKFAK